MSGSRLPTDDQTEQILAGAPVEDRELTVLEAFVEALRAEGARGVDEKVAARHVAAAAALARLAPDPAVDGAAARPGQSKLTNLRRKAVLGAFTSSLLAKILTGSVALAAVAGSAGAATGRLPEPAQAAVAEAASHVGLTLPSPEDEREAEQPESEELPEAAEHGQQVADLAQQVDGCEDALELSRVASEGQGPAEDARCGPAEAAENRQSEEREDRNEEQGPPGIPDQAGQDSAEVADEQSHGPPADHPAPQGPPQGRP